MSTPFVPCKLSFFTVLQRLLRKFAKHFAKLCENQCCGSGSKGSASFCRLRIYKIFHGSGCPSPYLHYPTPPPSSLTHPPSPHLNTLPYPSSLLPHPSPLFPNLSSFLPNPLFPHPPHLCFLALPPSPHHLYPSPLRHHPLPFIPHPSPLLPHCY